jgi:hypothetical protein
MSEYSEDGGKRERFPGAFAESDRIAARPGSEGRAQTMTTERLDDPETVKFVFEYDAQYRFCPATGVWGGITPHGDLRVDFYVDSFNPPVSITHSIGTDGSLGKESERDPARDPRVTVIARRLQVGLLIPGTQLDTFAAFLTQKANELKELKKGTAQ